MVRIKKIIGMMMMVGVRPMKELVTFIMATASWILLQQHRATTKKRPPTAHMA